ncbi:MAG TPA: Hsp20/alpha crystallin family protein, partial [Streptosporangiaceae bacterium]|nr:Hsp20/alpha crystallin family protein [Streptosporangiaceae bacterium]
TQPVPRRRPLERWRSGWPREVWDPFGDFNLVWERMNQMFGPPGEALAQGWVPVVETEEAADTYIVRAELPGMKRGDVDVELRGSELRITGEVKEEADGKTLRQRHGSFAYRATLPTDADVENAVADLSDGILTVRLPKAAQARSRRIEIKGSET